MRGPWTAYIVSNRKSSVRWMIQSIFKDLGFSNNSGKPNFAVSEFLNDSDTGKFADFWMNPIGIALER